MSAPFSRRQAERLLGVAALDAVRELVEAAPALRPEQRAQVRAVFASARPRRTPAAEAA